LEDFIIKNEWATVRFLEPVNVLDLDLDEIINFSHNSVELYPEEKFPTSVKPKIGEELNKPATIIFNQFGPENLSPEKE